MSFTLILPMILLAVPSLLLGVHVALSDWRRRRTPPELRGNWWARFDRDFRAYAARVTNGGGDTRRARGERHPPPSS